MEEPAATAAEAPDVIAWPWPEAERALRAAGWAVAVRRTLWRGAGPSGVRRDADQGQAQGQERVLAVRRCGPRALEAVVARFGADLGGQPGQEGGDGRIPPPQPKAGDGQ